MSDFRALVLREADRKIAVAFETLTEADLPDGDVLVRVSHSTVNYKDGMVMNGVGRLVREYPHVPGIDFSGTVEASDNPNFKPGDDVILTGWRVGETYWGAYAEKARVKGDWLVPLPDGLTRENAMAVGTAGFTAMMAVQALEAHGVTPGGGQVLVTGASGGVGSIATAILANLGYDVAASTGRPEQADYLKGLGAQTIIDRAELAELPSRPLGRERFAGAIDNVGGATLSNLLTQIAYGGSVGAVGLTGGSEVSSTVLPFLLRGINLLGIESVMCPKEPRVETWRRVARDLPMDKLRTMVEIHGLDDLPRLGKEILSGRVRGRTVIKIA